MLVSYFALLVVLATGCLAANTRVLNGEPAEPHQFPYHVAIYWKRCGQPILEMVYICGGALVSDKWVLTTGLYKSLTKEFLLYVKAGKHVVDQIEDSEQVRLVVRYLIHPEYKQYNDTYLISQNDLALLQVNTPFDFNEYVRAARIPSASAQFKSGILVGWNLSSLQLYDPKYPTELHYDASLPVVGVQDCSDAINKIASTYGSSSTKISTNHTCSGSGGEKSSACVRQEGVTFVRKVDNDYVIIGIVSATLLPCGVIDRPTVYTRVGAYSKWINKIIQSS